MRIVVVSALYPPNFVGGATVQARRLARGLRRRGHDVWVFAGRLDPEAAPLEVRDEVDETGLPVRWLVLPRRWLDFGNERNHACPEAEAAFAAFLAEVKPDVVHVHALQGLGAGVVRVAKEAGAAVVVTMHDWWWVCARQFLADTSFVPCCPVVDAGVCPCEVDRPWLDARRSWLDEQLRFADLILTPSAIAADSLIANGVDPARLEVDENGLEGVLGSSSERVPREGPVRFIYAGGPSEFKGVHLVFEAARLLATLDGWTLDAYGAGPWVRDHAVFADSHRVRVLEPFRPEEAGRVYDEADVLLLPSVMRESYSLVTREAMIHRLPVVCSDSLGPEEVVQDGRNGLVVPSADAAALAGAMRRIVTEPGLLEDLRRGCRAVPVRSLEDQLDGLEERYRAVPAPPAEHDAPGRVLFICGIEGAPLRYRVWFPSEALGLLGVRSDVRYFTSPDLEELAEAADAIVVYRVPATPRVLGLLEAVRRRGVPVLFDVDDLIFDPDIAEEIPALRILAPADAELWLDGVRRYRTTMEACDAFVGSTPALCRHATDVVGLPSHRFANGVGLRLGRLSDAATGARTPGPLRLAFLSGTTTHDEDWAYIEAAVARALERVPEAELWLVGHVPDTDVTGRLGSRLRRIGFVGWERLPALLRDIDVNLAPLAPGSRFNEAKSAIKWLEAALVETPTVASPTEPFREAIDHWVNGVLAFSPDEWTDALVELLRDDDRRRRIGTRARRDALLRYSPWKQGRRYLEILRETVSGAVPDVRRLETPVVREEPVRPYPLEPYGLALAAASGARSVPLGLGSARRWRVHPTPSGCEIRRIDVLVATYSGPGRPLSLRVLDAEGSVRATVEAEARMVADNAPVAFDLDPFTAAGPIEIEVSATGDGGRLALWGGPDETPWVRVWATPDERGPHVEAQSPAGGPPVGWAKARLAAYMWKTQGSGAVVRAASRVLRRRLRDRTQRRRLRPPLR